MPVQSALVSACGFIADHPLLRQHAPGSFMAAIRIDGKIISAEIRAEIKSGVDARTASGHRAPYLAVVLVGDDPASASYVRGKHRAAAEVGIQGDTLTYPSTIPEDELLGIVRDLNGNPDVDGILVQLPLPPHIDDQRIIETVDPSKDVDCFHPSNVGKLMLGLPGFRPATPAGIIELIERSGIAIAGKRAVIVGRSNIVTVCHSRTPDLGAVTCEADILVAAIGRAEMITADMVKPGAVVIDVGMNRVEDASRERGYRLTGDVAFDEVAEIASYITPVPGGVGPMTIALMLQNTLRAASRF